MRTFTSDGSFQIKGHGTAFSISAEQMPEDLWNPSQMRDSKVMIDGHSYIVKGVETFAIAQSPEQPYHHGFGLLVEEVMLANIGVTSE